MTTMLTVGSVIVSFFVTTLEKCRYCNMRGKQGMFRPLNLQWMTLKEGCLYCRVNQVHASQTVVICQGTGEVCQDSCPLSIRYKNASLQAAVIWLAKLASCNFSFRSVDNLGNTFKAMFPDSKIASSFSMGRSRASYVIGEGLGPHFTKVLYKVQLEKANESVFMC